jgi:hypothetical protein
MLITAAFIILIIESIKYIKTHNKNKQSEDIMVNLEKTNFSFKTDSRIN